MSRFHIHISVDNLIEAIQFYSAVFGASPTKVKADYAKWMLDTPKINFAISTRGKTGLNHLGVQVDSPTELEIIRERLRDVGATAYDEGETICCYAKSEKSWVNDPAGIPWEAYQTMEDAEIYKENDDSSCCAEPSDESCCAEPTENKTSCCGGSSDTTNETEKNTGCCS